MATPTAILKSCIKIRFSKNVAQKYTNRMSQNSISAVKNRGYYTNDLVISMVVAAVFNRDPIKLSCVQPSIKKSGLLQRL